MTRVRSPNYPAISLGEAIRRVQMIYGEEGRNPASRKALVKHMGFGGVNGASLSVLSGVIKYGLLKPVDDGESRVSDLALEILYPHSDADKAIAIRIAALEPLLFRDIKQKWPERPPSDEGLKAYLVRRGFSQKALGNVIKPYRATTELVNESSGDYNEEISRITAQTAQTTELAMQKAQGVVMSPHQTPPPPFSGAMRVSITSGGLEVSAHLVDEKQVDKLIQILRTNKILLQTVHEPFDTGDDDEEEYSNDGEERENG